VPHRITLPGIYGSGPTHWQSLWEQDGSFRRFSPSSWDRPQLADWQAALTAALNRADAKPVLVAHSLSCLLVGHSTDLLAGRIAGAMLVAPPDPAGPAFPDDGAQFGPAPQAALPFPTLLIASSNDPYGSLAFAQTQAQAWNARLVVAGAFGHINGESGLDDWPQGRGLLAAFEAGLGV